MPAGGRSHRCPEFPLSKLLMNIEFPTKRTAWFEQARFGMFIHWGLYSLHGHGEWAMNRERIPLDEYTKLADEFAARDYNPKAWAALARDAGMKYMVLTTKHHEGFCLWDSKTCAFNSTTSAAKRDLLAEFVEAVRDAGLKVGLYYSLGDWFNPDWTGGWQGDAAAKIRFMSYTHALVRELMTGYGKIDILWYDLPQCYSPAEWRSVELNAMARSLQPHILINNRAMTTEDFATPEQRVSAAPRGRMWESCMTLNDNWGYCPSDRNWKSPRKVVLNLANAAAGAGNLLLNIGPDGQGAIPPESERILRSVGDWLSVHGEGIYGSQRHDLMWTLFGPITRKDHALYLHLKNHFGPTLAIGGLTNKVFAATLLTSGEPLEFEQCGARTFVRGLPESSRDDLLPVVKLQIEGEPDSDVSRVIGGADIFPAFPA